METTFIYSLSDPITGEIRYIGKANNPKKRILDHVRENKTSNKSHKISWIKSLIAKDLLPIVEIVDEVPKLDWEFWEQYWISQFKYWGFNLTNISPGGYNNNYKRTTETKKKMRISKLGTTLPIEHRKKISESVKLKAKENPLYNRGEGNSRKFLDKELLYQKYIIENLSLNKCASFFDVSKKTVFTNITEYSFKKDKSNWIGQVASNPEKYILQFDKDDNFIKEWLGLKSITKELGINSSNIANCCRGVAKSAGGFIWKYK